MAEVTIERTQADNPENYTIEIVSEQGQRLSLNLAYFEIQQLRNKCTKTLRKNKKSRLLQ